MAAIDKIYGTYEQWCELHAWIARSRRPQYCAFFYPTPAYNSGERAIAYFPERADKWLWENCPFNWVREQLVHQYGEKGPGHD